MITLLDEIKINLHMFCALILNGVGGEVYGADIVTVDESAARWQSLELMQPGGLSHTIDDDTALAFGAGTALAFGAGAGDDSLPLSRPGDQAVLEEHGIA
jgi:hypothetical protein